MTGGAPGGAVATSAAGRVDRVGGVGRQKVRAYVGRRPVVRAYDLVAGMPYVVRGSGDLVRGTRYSVRRS